MNKINIKINFITILIINYSSYLKSIIIKLYQMGMSGMQSLLYTVWRFIHAMLLVYGERVYSYGGENV